FLPWNAGGAFDQWDGRINVMLNLPYLWGGEQNGGGLVGSFLLHEGTDVQQPSATYELVSGVSQPAYPKLVYLYANDVWHGEFPQPKSIEWVIRAFPHGLDAVQFLAAWEAADGDASPASCILALLTNPDIGLGIPFSMVDYAHPGTFPAVH